MTLQVMPFFFFEEMYVRGCLRGHKWLVLLTIKEAGL